MQHRVQQYHQNLNLSCRCCFTTAPRSHDLALASPIVRERGPAAWGEALTDSSNDDDADDAENADDDDDDDDRTYSEREETKASGQEARGGQEVPSCSQPAALHSSTCIVTL
eukprot:2785178-Pyramimonas_sp.AAC.1